jgi:polysaccharide export outer membrane protein
MRLLIFTILALMSILPATCQQSALPLRANAGSSQTNGFTVLPVQKIGRDDLLSLTVYDEPELTRTVRVDSEGDLRLPMLKKAIHAAGLFPSELEEVISSVLVEQNVLVDPIVTVSVVEYRSRPITVVGAVKNPITFQETGTVTLLDALSQAQGLTENAGSEILVYRLTTDGKPENVIRRIPVLNLLRGEDPTLNLQLEGGEEIRVPEAGRIFVVGNVKKPGAYYITDGSKSSLMKALALSEGLDTFSGSKAYIYRLAADGSGRNEIPLELKKILQRKSPDVALEANDILYIPDASGMRTSMKVLETTVAISASIGAAALYAYH